MKDREFFFPGDEQASPGVEVSQPGRESAEPGLELFHVGGEYLSGGQAIHHITGQTPKREKKKRRINPMVFTAAVVATGMVAISGINVSERNENTQHPFCELTAEHQAYLNEVWTAVESSELDRMTELANDVRLRDLIVEYIQPYAHMVEETYDASVVWGENYYVNDIRYTNDEGGSYYVYYDGEHLGTWEALGEPYGETLLWVTYSKRIENFSVTLEVSQRAGSIDGEQWQDKVFDYSRSLSGDYERIFWYDRLMEHVQY